MGIAFVALFAVGNFGIPTPGRNANKGNGLKWQRWWADSGHRAGAILGAYLVALSLLAFLWFAWSLRQRFRDQAGLIVVFGSVFAAVALVSVGVRVSVAGAKQFGNTALPAGDFARQFDQIGFGLLLTGGALLAGAFVAVLSYLSRQDRSLPGWLTIGGYVVAVLQLAAAFFFPFVLFLLWILIASIVLVRRGSPATSISSR